MKSSNSLNSSTNAGSGSGFELSYDNQPVTFQFKSSGRVSKRSWMKYQLHVYYACRQRTDRLTVSMLATKGKFAEVSFLVVSRKLHL